MKIGQGQVDASQLIERMQKAHAEGGEVGHKGDFSLAAPAAATEQAKASSPLEANVKAIAERVLSGDLKDAQSTRREVLSAIVEDKFGALVEPSQKRRTLDMLELTLGEDPGFTREIDEMLVLAARALSSAGGAL